MIHLTKTLARRWLESLLHIHDSPKRTALAYAVGVFFGFSPPLGLHTILAVLVAFLFNLNRVAVVLGVYTNVPWLVAPYYTLTTAAAAEALGVRVPHDFAARLRALVGHALAGGSPWPEAADLLRPLLWPYVLGSLAGALLLGAAAYVVSRPFIEAGRKHLHLHGRHHAPPEAG